MVIFMLSSIRTKAAELVKGKKKIYTLLALDVISLILCVNLLPILYENSLAIFVKINTPEYEHLINFIAASVMLFLACALRFSFVSSAGRYFYKRAMGENTDIGDVFYYLSFDVFVTNFLFRLKLSLAKLVCFTFCFLPLTSVFFFLYRTAYSGASVLVIVVMTFTAVIFLITGIIYYCKFSSLLFLCPYIFYVDNSKSFFEIVSESQGIMKKRVKSLNKIRVSFIPSFILCVFLVPAIYVWSVYNQTKAVAARCFLGS